MRNAVKYIVGAVYKPLLVKYLSKERRYRYKGIEMLIPPEVFHPGFFSSTKLLLNYISSYPLINHSLLELGAGSGLISIFAARKGAEVMASDINATAVRYLHKNTYNNQVKINIIQSDLFKNIPEQTFDYIIINPPYYKKNPLSESEYAWYCGENGEYFEKLFSQLLDYTHHATKIYMVLCDGCDLEMIKRMAAKNLIELNCVQQSSNWVEDNFIFKLDSRK
jgi:release factor glutamine methyltransferase